MRQKPTFVDTEMENKGITKKQFRIQSISSYLNLVLGLIWIWIGIDSNQPFEWILGIVFILLSAGSILSLYLQWKHHPVVDEELDRQATQNFKESLKGMAITIDTFSSYSEGHQNKDADINIVITSTTGDIITISFADDITPYDGYY